MKFRDIENLDETKIDISKLGNDDQAVMQLWSKNQLAFRALSDFWKPSVVEGKKAMDYVHGNIFDASTRATYEQIQNKVCIEPKILKPRINSLVGQIKQGRRSGKIISEGGGSAEEIYLANVVLNYFGKELEEQYLLDQALFNGCVTGYPQVLMFDRAVTSYGDVLGGLSLTLLDWDATLLGDGYKRPDGADVTEIITLERQSKEQMIADNPKREKAIREFYDKMASDYDWSGSINSIDGLSVDDARILNYDAITGMSSSQMDGKMLVLRRLHVVKIDVDVAILKSENIDETLDYQIIPDNWSKAKKQRWLEENPEYTIENTKVEALWESKWTKEGLMLKNEKHWFQENNSKGHPILPIAVFVPQVVDGKPTGPGIDDIPLVLMKAISETEFLHDIRTGSGDLFAYMQGSVINHADLPTELSTGDGIAVIDPNKVANINDAVQILHRSTKTTYSDYSNKVSADLDNTDLINRSVQGASVPNQSGKSKNVEITQALVGYSIIVGNYNKTYERLKDLECQMIPYSMAEQAIIEVEDENTGEENRVEINIKEYDEQGDERIVANDLTSYRWKYKLVQGDDSETAKQAELNELMIFWNTAAPALIKSDDTLGALASVLMSMSNKTAKDTGKIIAKKAQVQAQAMNKQQMAETMMKMKEANANADAVKLKAMRSGFSFSVVPDDFAQHPEVYQMLVGAGYINPQNQFQLPEEQQQQNLTGVENV